MTEPIETTIRKMLRANKMSGRKIASELGCPYSMVLRIRDEFSMPQHRLVANPVPTSDEMRVQAGKIGACWTPIAYRERVAMGEANLKWHALDDAPIHYLNVWPLVERGMLVMAQRHEDERVTLLVRRAVG